MVVDDESDINDQVTLTRRVDNGAYGTSAYSFRYTSQQFATHRNYVDLVFNICGQIHINPHGGMKSRIADLGDIPLKNDVAPPMPAILWYHRSIRPQQGHVYLQEVDDGRQNFAVKFRILQATTETLTFEWLSVDPARKPVPMEAGRGAAGTMGQCGGWHDER